MRFYAVDLAVKLDPRFRMCDASNEGHSHGKRCDEQDDEVKDFPDFTPDDKKPSDENDPDEATLHLLREQLRHQLASPV